MTERVGHYRITRKLGEGGMGAVYAAEDARKRLWREARSLARVKHPGVCQIYDVCEDGSDLVLVMELLEGEPLSDRLAGGALPPAESVSIVCSILDALGALHDL